MARGKTHPLIRKKAVADLGVLTVADVAERYGMTPPTIRKWAREFDESLPEPRRPDSPDRPPTLRTLQIRLMVALFGRQETARRLGISKQYVSRVSKGVRSTEADIAIQLLGSLFSIDRQLMTQPRR